MKTLEYNLFREIHSMLAGTFKKMEKGKDVKDPMERFTQIATSVLDEKKVYGAKPPRDVSFYENWVRLAIKVCTEVDKT